MKKYNQRQQQIIELVNNKNYISVNDLCEILKVSVVTIRKDLTFLENKNELFRTHGGASRSQSYAFEKNVKEKETLQVQQKKEIAKKALGLINENDFILMGSGTTLHYLARIINDFNKLTVLTSSLRISLELAKKNNNIDIIQLGGNVRESSTSIVGPIAEKMLESFSFTKLFLGVDGIDFDFGISTSNAMEAHLNNLMIKKSDKVIVLADSSKMNKRGFGKICELTKIDTLITDKDILQEDLKKIEKLAIEVIIC